VVVVVPGDKFVVKKEARTFEEASDMAAASLERSLKRFKQKQRVHTAS
jgi:putative sigma-54 modulation protein